MRIVQWRTWLLLLFAFCMPARAEPPAVALHYGATPPWDELRAFDVVVVEPDHPGIDPQRYRHPDSRLFA
ncbi:MAG: hypothetical protein K0Q43_5711, partial [Ramlibacter sp.]|nr:hypothetical protein [Ramlibacter sp.]